MNAEASASDSLWALSSVRGTGLLPILFKHGEQIGEEMRRSIHVTPLLTPTVTSIILFI